MSAIELTAGMVAGAMRQAGGRLVAGDPAQVFTRVSIDTRTIAAGDLFVGIRGERMDGAAFACDALASGAAGVVVPQGWRAANAECAGSRAVVEVDDTTAALQSLAATIRIESGTKVVAITGSAGKTTTKEITAELLGVRYRVIRNRGNFNNHIGLPLSLIDLRERPEIAVVELGMNHAGEISTLVGIAQPDVRVWTNVGEAHLGFFPSVDAIADAKAEMLEGAEPSTVLVANADDPRIMQRSARFVGTRVTFGIEHAADVRATDVVDRGIDGTSVRVQTPTGAIDLTIPLVGLTNVSNVLAAIAVALEFDISLVDIASRVASLAPAAHRGEVVRLANGITIVDDSYNANPTATIRALDVLRGPVTTGRRIAVLGEMLELGDRSRALHEDVGRAVAAARLDALLTVGGDPAVAMAVAAVGAGMPANAVNVFADSDGAADALVSLIAPGDLVLVKGSRGVKTDRIVARVKAERG